jgi:HSP20 family molecular chaperone IbpA
MTEKTGIKTQNKAEIARSDREALIPAVDVFEDQHGIMLTADLPGVGAKELKVEVFNDTLLIEGDLSIDIPSDMEPSYADVRNARYRRSFALSSELDSDAIDAQIKDGVLTVKLPKRKALQPRNIEVQAG